MEFPLLLAGLFFAVAVLYSSVGHGGGSAYLAIMALFAVSPEVMKPTALALNVVVSSIALARFYRAGHFSRRIFLPFALGSVPFAFIGGGVLLPAAAYRTVVGLVLLYGAYRLSVHAPAQESRPGTRPLRTPVAVGIGAGIGFLSGLIGVGGGIFLTPLLLLAGLAGVRTAAAVSAAFVLVNSIAGLLGVAVGVGALPSAFPVWAIAVGIGGWAGAGFGSRILPAPALRGTLALVLVLAGCKLVLL